MMDRKIWFIFGNISVTFDVLKNTCHQVSIYNLNATNLQKELDYLCSKKGAEKELLFSLMYH